MTNAEGRGLRILTLGVITGGFVLPIFVGLWQTVAAAFGYLPAIGATEHGLLSWWKLAALPGIWTSLALTLWTGLAATLLALLLAFGCAAAAYGRIGTRHGLRFLTPLLAAPHAAMAIGLAFLIAPSGWVARAFSPWATGWQLPPDLATVHDSTGLALILGLRLSRRPAGGQSCHPDQAARGGNFRHALSA